MWPDGVVNITDGEASVSVGTRSSVTVFTKGILDKQHFKNADISPIKPDSLIVIITEKDDRDHSVNEHVDYLRIVHHNIMERGILTSLDESDSFDVAILKTSQESQIIISERNMAASVFHAFLASDDPVSYSELFGTGTNFSG